MPLAQLAPSPNSIDLTKIDMTVARFRSLLRATDYLNTCQGELITVTDNITDLNDANQKALMTYGVTMVDGRTNRIVPKEAAATPNGYSQRTTPFRIWMIQETRSKRIRSKF